jgi:hypothetical protein
LICLFVSLSPVRVTGLDALLECRVRSALLPGSGHHRALTVTQNSHDVFFRHLFSPGGGSLVEKTHWRTGTCTECSRRAAAESIEQTFLTNP